MVAKHWNVFFLSVFLRTLQDIRKEGNSTLSQEGTKDKRKGKRKRKQTVECVCSERTSGRIDREININIQNCYKQLIK
jgi:hypothetical protein